MSTVYRNGQSQLSYKEAVAEFETEREAEDFCESCGWEMADENGFVWNLDYTVK